MYPHPTDTTPEPIKTPCFEFVARVFVRNFGEDALAMIDRTIEGLEAKGEDAALEIWHDIRATLLRQSVTPAPALLQ